MQTHTDIYSTQTNRRMRKRMHAHTRLYTTQADTRTIAHARAHTSTHTSRQCTHVHAQTYTVECRHTQRIPASYVHTDTHMWKRYTRKHAQCIRHTTDDGRISPSLLTLFPSPLHSPSLRPCATHTPSGQGAQSREQKSCPHPPPAPYCLRPARPPSFPTSEGKERSRGHEWSGLYLRRRRRSTGCQAGP